MRNYFIYSLIGLLGLLSCTPKAPKQDWINSNWQNKMTLAEQGWEVPDWMNNNRVQAHSRHPLKMMTSNDFFEVSEDFEKMGCKVYTRHFKTAGEPCWWKTKHGECNPEAVKADIVNQIIKNPKTNNQHLIAYYWHMTNHEVSRDHRDWICKNDRGEIIKTPRGNWLCFNSPYRTFLKNRLLELIDLGVEGLYFDFAHTPEKGCWCKYCKEKFHHFYNTPFPVRVDKKDPAWQKLMDLNNNTVTETFIELEEAIHKKNSNAVLIVSSHKWPSLASRHIDSKLFRHIDIHKLEFALGYNAIHEKSDFPINKNKHPLLTTKVLNPMSYILSRDATDGRPPHIWIHGLQTDKAAKAATAGILANGGIANINVLEDEIKSSPFISSFQLGEKISPYMAEAKPVKWAAIHYSEQTKNKYINNPTLAWSKVLFPICGLFEALFSNHMPVGFITDSQLEDGLLDDYQILILTGERALNPKMSQVVEQFKKRGGQVIINETSWDWGKNPASAKHFFLTSLSQIDSPSPIKVLSSESDIEVNAYHKNKDYLLIHAVNDYSWVFTGKKDRLANIKEKAPGRYKQIKNKKYQARSKKNIEIIIDRKLIHGFTKARDIISGQQIPITFKDNGEASIFLDKIDSITSVIIE